jgi:hypothetical protein
MSLKDELERIIALEEAEAAQEDQAQPEAYDEGKGVFAPLVAAMRELKARIDQRPRT